MLHRPSCSHNLLARTQFIAIKGSQSNAIERFKSKRLGYLIGDKESHLVCECKSISIDLYNMFVFVGSVWFGIVSFCFVLFCSLSLFAVVLVNE